MFEIIEFCLLVFWATMIYVIVRKHSVCSIFSLVIFLASSLGSFAATYLATCASGTVSDPLVVFLLPGIVGVVAFSLIAFWAKRRVSKSDKLVEFKKRCISRMHGHIDIGVRALFVVLHSSLIMLVVFFVVNMVVFSEGQLSQNTHAIQQDTFFLKYFVIDEESSSGATSRRHSSNHRKTGEVAEARSKFGAQIPEKPGITKLAHYVGAVIYLSKLSERESNYIVSSNHALKRLVDNKKLKEVMGNERIVGQLLDMSAGSVSAVYKLAKDPLIGELLKDDVFRATVNEIDILQLRQNVVEFREKVTHCTQPSWLWTSVESPADFRVAFNSTAGWNESMSGQLEIEYPKENKFGLAMADIEFTDNESLTIECITDAKVSVWFNNKFLAFKKTENGYELPLNMVAGERKKALVVTDFSSTKKRAIQFWLCKDKMVF